MLRFTDIVQGRHSVFEPKLSHFVATLIVFIGTYYIAEEYRYVLPWYGTIVLLVALLVSSLGLVVSFGSLRHSKMIVVQGLAFGFIAAQFSYDWTMKIAYGAGTCVAICVIVPRLCTRFLKLRNIWETSTGILAFCALYPYSMAVVYRLLY